VLTPFWSRLVSPFLLLQWRAAGCGHAGTRFLDQRLHMTVKGIDGLEWVDRACLIRERGQALHEVLLQRRASGQKRRSVRTTGSRSLASPGEPA